MENTVSFYHFNTKEAMDNASLKDTDIAFCKETKTIRTHGTDYGESTCWEQIPEVSTKQFD